MIVDGEDYEWKRGVVWSEVRCKGLSTIIGMSSVGVDGGSTLGNIDFHVDGRFSGGNRRHIQTDRGGVAANT